MARSTGAQRLVLGFLNRPPSNMYVGVWMSERLITDNKPYIWRRGFLILYIAKLSEKINWFPEID